MQQCAQQRDVLYFCMVQLRGSGAINLIMIRLEQAGGILDMHTIKQEFGVTRQELRDQGLKVFQDKFKSGTWCVSLPDRNINTGNSLDVETLQRVIDMLAEAGGALPLSYVTKQCSGVKKVQLEEHFELNQTGPGLYEVRIAGTTSETAKLMFGGKPVADVTEIPSVSECLPGPLVSRDSWRKEAAASILVRREPTRHQAKRERGRQGNVHRPRRGALAERLTTRRPVHPSTYRRLAFKRKGPGGTRGARRQPEGSPRGLRGGHAGGRGLPRLWRLGRPVWPEGPRPLADGGLWWQGWQG